MVQDLAQSGQDLTWNDFDDYPYEDIGSGLYIRNYKIDEDYHVSVGGASIEKKPLYIYLVKANGEKIDIRHDDMEQFMLK
ncbi:hypothetical protein [Paenibacillus pini]|uniref:Uncharacterized protein n=2 Tax=Paenibacillus TaxID=44249 RepID=W7YP35_9BACL|nr:hypothetical protein JCM16418_3512 [Paenibacillus pini JCM 16418]